MEIEQLMYTVYADLDYWMQNLNFDIAGILWYWC